MTKRFGADQFRIGLPHFTDERGHQFPHQRVLRAEKLRVAHRTAHDPAQHVAPALVQGGVTPSATRKADARR